MKAMTDLSRYYFERLSPADRAVYEALLSGLFARKSEIVTPAVRDPLPIVRAVNFDCPSLFFVNWVESFRMWREGSRSVFSFAYLYGREESLALEGRIDAYAREVAGISVYGKARTLYDRLTRSLDYDSEGLSAPIRSPSLFNAVGPLLHRRAVCEGVSKFACAVLRRLGVPSAVAVGRHGGVGHAWNFYRHEDGRVAYTDFTFGIGVRDTRDPYRYFDLDRRAIARDRVFET